MENRIFRAVFIALISFIVFASSSNHCLGVEGFPKGETISQVFCKANLKQSYALFLPTRYTEDKTWPVLYCFDPFSQGKAPLEHFKEAAEKYGYILIGLNNSRNGPVEQSVASLDAVWKDTQERLSIDRKRIYIAGFSGGARLASIIGSLCGGCIEGVVACGAGFQIGLEPSANLPFVYFGTIGTDDFNYPEMKNLEEDLDKKGITNRFEVFEGAHTWAPKDLCVKALGWMELQAMKRGKREKDESLIGRLFDEEAEEMRRLEAKGNDYEAYLKYEAIAADYKGLRDVSEYEKEAMRLKKTPKVKKALKEEDEEAREQQAIERDILNLTQGIKDPDIQAITLAQLRKRVAEIRRDAEEIEDTGKRRVARRALGNLFEEFYEVGTIVQANNYRLAVANLEIATEINPDDGRAPYGLACAHATKGENKKALAALKKAVEKGFTNIAAIDACKGFESLRRDAEYQRIIESIYQR